MNTEIIFFSEHIKAFKCWANIAEALGEAGVSFDFLPNTKDYWVRDFMPVELSLGRYVFYNYTPDYLRNDDTHRTPDARDCYDFSHSETTVLPLTIDGGNVIMRGGKVIMTEKVFTENHAFTKSEVIKKIEEAFQAELIIIPWDRDDKCGHADGMVRFISDSHVVINAYKDYNLPMRKKLMAALSPHFNEIDELEYGKANRLLSWAHLNFLQTDDHIFVPLVNKPSDSMAIEQIKSLFGPEYNVHGVQIENIVRQGGALNCVSWNVSEQ